MNFNSVFTTRRAFYILPVVFFWMLFTFAIEFGFTTLFPRAYDQVLREMEYGFFFFYLISFTGSALLLYSFREKQLYRNFIIPFSGVTAFGILFFIIKFLYFGTPGQWPLIPITEMLLNLSNLLLAPAIALLLFPFIKERESPPPFFWKSLLGFSLLATCVALLIIIDFMPLFDPEFVWSEFWDFSITNMWVSVFYVLYIIFGMPLVGLLSVFIIDSYLKTSSGSPGGR
jgi:hypothetical protein